jgi:hypothetical protein
MTVARWDYRVKIKHLLTDAEDWETTQATMNAIADVLEKEPCFRRFYRLAKFREIPHGDDVFGAVDYAIRLLEEMYDYADAERIWIG